MDNYDINEKINLIKQINEYEKKGYKLNKHYSISNDIKELKFQLEIFQKEHHIKEEFKFFESICKIKSILLDEPISQKEELLKFCYGSNEYYKQQFHL
jgi:hypothetical protein